MQSATEQTNGQREVHYRIRESGGSFPEEWMLTMSFEKRERLPKLRKCDKDRVHGRKNRTLPGEKDRSALHVQRTVSRPLCLAWVHAGVRPRQAHQDSRAKPRG